LALNKRTQFSIRLLTVIPLLASFLLFAGASAPDELIRKVERRYNSAQTLSVNFVENYSVQGRRRPPEIGTLTLRKQGKMRWDYRQPSGKLFISDGKNVYLYTARDNRVEKVPFKDTEDMRAPLAFLLGHLDMKKEFREFRVHEDDGGTWLEAVAKSDRLPYSAVEMLVISDGSIRQLKVMGRDESVLMFTLSDEKLNVSAPNELFDFSIPPGAEVVDAVEFAAQEK
jgi:outer membrane lipoprotein carrier protein